MRLLFQNILQREFLASPSCLFQHLHRKLHFLFDLHFSSVTAHFLFPWHWQLKVARDEYCLKDLVINEHFKASLPLELTRKVMVLLLSFLP